MATESNLPIHVLIVEDEPAAQNLLRNYVERLPSLDIASICNNALEATSYLHNNTVDIIFCDIKMPHLSGIEFIRTLKHPPAIVLTTAFSEYALEGYELDVVDYLLKPFSFERFLKAVNKCLHQRGQDIVKHTLSSTAKQTSETMVKVIDKGRMIDLPCSEILYIESYGNYVRLHTHRKIYMLENSLSSLEQTLAHTSFIRIHKSYIANLRYVENIEAEAITIGDKRLPIGRMYKLLVTEKLQNMQ